METTPTTSATKTTPLHVAYSFGELAKMLLEIREVISSYPEPMGLPEKKKAYTVDEWNKHVEISDLATKFNEELKDNKHISNQKRIEIQRAIETILPTSHIWFLTNDKKYAVAIQRSDWPGQEAEILIRVNPVIEDLPALKLRTTNFN